MNENFKPLDKEILANIRRAILEEGSATKVELSKILDISFPTISKFLSQMEKNREVISAGLDESSGGRRAERYMYNPDFMLGLAVFLESDKINYLIFNCAGEIKEQGIGPSVLLIDNGIHLLTNFIEKIITTYDLKVSSLAIGIPGSVDNDRIFYIPDYQQFHNVDLKGYLQDYFSIPIVVENDMNAAVLGFYHYKKMLAHQSLVYLNVSHNGQGAGFMINGDIVRGNTFFAGEISFVPQYYDQKFGQAFKKRDQLCGEPIYGEKQIDAIARLVASFVAIINPYTIIIHSDQMNQEIIKQICTVSSTYIPSEHLPNIEMSHLKKDYLYGLKRLALDLLMTQ